MIKTKATTAEKRSKIEELEKIIDEYCENLKARMLLDIEERKKKAGN